jgi:tripartite-type tricarboxylate transporter receptor subunit TctC
MMTLGRLGLCTGLFFALVHSAAYAQSATDFYAGKTITLVIGSGVGGSFDSGGRLVAQYLKQYIPGHPTVVPQNMPGASSVIATEYLFNKAARDGTTLGFVQPTVTLNKVLNPNAKYDPRQLTWIGRLQRMVFLGLVSHDAPAHSIAEAKTHQVVMAANSATGAAAMIPWALNALVGTKFKVIRGYKSASANFLALERGEVQGIGSTGLPDILKRPEMTAKKQITILYIIDVIRTKRFPDAPTIVELAGNENDRTILTLLGNPASIGQAVMAPPGVPKERRDVLREAFAKMMKDPQFLADAKKRDVEPNMLSGPELEKLVAENFSVPQALIDKLKTVTSPPAQ